MTIQFPGNQSKLATQSFWDQIDLLFNFILAVFSGFPIYYIRQQESFLKAYKRQ